MQHWEVMLSRRGLLGEALAAGWKPSGAGWQYPLYDSQGKPLPVTRWKAFDSAAKPKYLWSGDGERPRYYLLPDVTTAIQEALGVAILASGEPDVLAYRAAGARNVLCWFGEGQTPDTLAADLAALGVTAIECYPDRDATGAAWARAIKTRLQGSTIEPRIYLLPGEPGSKRDINRLWVDCQFDQDKFWAALVQCPPLLIEAEPAKAPSQPHLTDSELPADFYAAIASALGVEGYKADGWSKPVRCPLKSHEHDDKAPAAAWHRDKRIFSCLKCGVTDMLAKDIGAKLNLDWRNYLPPKAEPKPAPRPKPAGQPKILYTWNDGVDRLLAQLAGDVPCYEPLTLPFHAIRALGGFAKRIEPGKCIAIVGDSGMGKTSLIETVLDYWRKESFNGVIWGPEWSYASYVQRAIQRAGGPSYERLEDHKAYLSEVKRGVLPGKGTGYALSEAQMKYTRDLAEQLRRWPGALTFVERMNLPIEAVIANMSEVADRTAADGKRLSFAVLDYAQLVNATGETEVAKLDHVLDAFKGLCVDRALVGVVGSQMTKSDGRAAAHGATAGLHAMVSARSDVFNLALVLTRELGPDGKARPLATCRVVKNSIGQTGDVQLFLNTEKLSWHDVDYRHAEMPAGKAVTA